MSASRKPTLNGLIASLHKADAALSAAIDKRNQMDEHDIAARKSGGRQTPKQRRNYLDRAEARGHDVTSDALEALCRYRPRTPEELSTYLLTVLNHWRIRDASLVDETDRDCIVRLLVNINASTAALLLRSNRTPQ